MNPTLLPSLALFVRVAHHLSFTRAADEVGVSRAALSQNIKTLERQLGVRLLYRTTRHMSLTEAGQKLLDTLQPSLGNIEQALEELNSTAETPSGLVRINTSRLAARELLEPKLEAFFARYPKVTLELVMADSLSNIIADGCDVGIRLGRSVAEHMIAVPISPALSMAVVGSPAYLQRHGTPQTPADLAQHHCINYRYAGSGAIHAWEFTEPDENGRQFTQTVSGNLISNDDASMTRAAVHGLGLMQLVDLAIQNELADGRLVRVLGNWRRTHPGFYLYAPSREQMPSKVRALIDFLVETRQTTALL